MPVIEPLRGLLDKLKAQSPDGYILQNSTAEPLSLDSLNGKVIKPAMKVAGIAWQAITPDGAGSVHC